jgi:SAM-dependent methyltransferase
VPTKQSPEASSASVVRCPHRSTGRIQEFEGVALNECGDCGVVFSDRYAREGFDAKNVYNSFYKNEIAGRFNFGVELVVRLFRLYRAFKIFTIYPRAKSILDIGSGRGFTLYFLKKIFRYHTTVGTQIDPAALKFSREKLGLDIYGEDLLKLDLKDGQFDLVTMWHVLEHLPDPEAYVERIRRLLKDNGKLIIEVPNFASWTRRFSGQYWLGLDLKYHLCFFDYASLSGLLKKHGFKVTLVHTFSLEYSTFISVQSLVSRLTNSDQLFFSWLQGQVRFSLGVVWSILLFVILTPVCFLVNLFLFFSHRGEVLLVVAEKG